ncbi:hypothetical protein [Acetivibrio cellulolyticus]|uniref:hypothetical protein n=1 Tax=Acetivibrio cellulolyticus TaxID=35830 RepID=UPI0001E2DEE5|nr:hypothetical protein [Acetivibrio cellulolyticus]
MNSSGKQECENSVVLYGISKVEYGAEGCTPYPMCVKSCANYLGQDVSIDFSMVSTGAAFRLTWDTTSWNCGNVDIMHTFDSPEETYKLGIEALGREYQIITRANTSCDIEFNSSNNSDNKNDFISFITKQIDKGFPCIALGIIGPPEACIISGYRDNGETLLGWNFFQDATEFATDVRIDESGYFISSKWWENNETIAVISLGEQNKLPISNKAIIENAIKVLTGRLDKRGGKTFAKGLMAYDAWKSAILNESDFPQNAILPILAERLMCQGDAMDCLIDGRNNAAIFMKKLSEEMKEHSNTCKVIEEQFAKVAKNVSKMADVLGGYARNEMQMQNFAKSDIRHQIAALIDECKVADSKALEGMKLLVNSL